MKIILNDKEFKAMQDMVHNVVDETNKIADLSDEERIESIYLMDNLNETEGCEVSIENGNIIIDYDEEFTVDILNLYEETIKDSIPVFIKVTKKIDELKGLYSLFKPVLEEVGILKLVGSINKKLDTFIKKWSEGGYRLCK